MSVKKKVVEKTLDDWANPVRYDGDPRDWVWVEENGIRVRPATKTWTDFPRLKEPLLTNEEIDELLKPDREDER